MGLERQYFKPRFEAEAPKKTTPWKMPLESRRSETLVTPPRDLELGQAWLKDLKCQKPYKKHKMMRLKLTYCIIVLLYYCIIVLHLSLGMFNVCSFHRDMLLF